MIERVSSIPKDRLRRLDASSTGFFNTSGAMTTASFSRLESMILVADLEIPTRGIHHQLAPVNGRLFHTFKTAAAKSCISLT
jgi:hypothetical protein